MALLFILFALFGFVFLGAGSSSSSSSDSGRIGPSPKCMQQSGAAPIKHHCRGTDR